MCHCQINRQQQLEAARLAEQQSAEKEARKNELYRYSCKQLIDAFDNVVEQFNSQYQHGKITHHAGPSGLRYVLPTGGHITFSFFPRHESDLRIKGGQLIGGGHIEVERNISANLLLVCDGDDDLYGRWIGCFLRIRGFVDPRKIIGRYGITTEPFGLKYQQDFYHHIEWAEHGLHSFKYELRTDMKQFFIDILETALQEPVHDE